MRTIGYIRVSTDGQAQEGISLEAQEAKIRAWADLNGYSDVVIFRDAGISGKRADNRPGLMAAISATERGDALVVFSLSRLSRSVIDTLTISKDLEGKGVDLVSISDRIDTTTAAGKLFFTISAAFNQHFRDTISDHTKSALDQKRAKREKTGGKLPFGFDLDTDGKTLVPNAAEQEALSIMRELRGAGMSYRKIGAELTARGIGTKGGGIWQAMTIRGLCEARQ